MWNKLRKNKVFQYAVAIIMLGLASYLVFIPVLISTAFPQYGIIKKYSNIGVCTDLPPGIPSKVFLPVSCASLNATHAIGCTYDSTHYMPPAVATADEKAICPLLVSDVDATGAKNPALAVLPIGENTLHTLLTMLLLTAVVGIYIGVRVSISRKRKKATIVQESQDDSEN